MLRQEMRVWVVEMVGRISKGINFKFGEKILRDFLQKPVDHHATFDASLTVENEDDFGEIRPVQQLLNRQMTVSDILCRVVKIALYQALDDIEEYSITTNIRSTILQDWCKLSSPLVMNAQNGTSKC